MGCPSCNYTSNCGSYVNASFIPSDSGHSYSNSIIPSESYPIANSSYKGSSSYSNKESPSYLPVELDYHISKALKEMDVKKDYEPENGIKEVPSNTEIVAVEPDVVEIRPEEMEIRDALGDVAKDLANNQKVRIIQTEIEEEIVIKRRIRQRSVELEKKG